MTKQEQIEEMISTLAASNNPFVDVPVDIMPQVAKVLYNAGYRKSEEVRKETAKEIVARLKKYDSYFDDYQFDKILDDIELDYGVEVEE